MLRQLPPPVRGRLRALSYAPRLSRRRVPTDRDYIERFAASHAGLIQGRVLTTRTPALAYRFGHNVTRIDVLDDDPFNDDVTLLADLSEAGSLPPGVFDCVILDQVLQREADRVVAVENAWRSVAPGGALLAAVPVLRALHSSRDLDSEYIMAAGLKQILARGCPNSDVEFTLYGKVLTEAARLMIVAPAESSAVELDARNRDSPVVSCALVMKRVHA